MKKITILGAGMMGSALAFPARENGNEVRLVGTPLDREIIDVCKKTNRHPKLDRDFPAGVSYHQIEELGAVLADTDFIILGVSSFGVDWFGDEILPTLDPRIPILSVTKGLFDTADGTLLTYPAVWADKAARLGKRFSFNAIGGPCTSYELVAHDSTMVAFCGEDMETLRMLRAAMETDYYHVSLSRDVVGIESAVALKNGYALGIALTIGVNKHKFANDTLHFNSQAGVFYQAAREMKALLSLQGAPDFENLAVGLGDLYVTVYGGRTRYVGILLGEGYSIAEAKEKLRGVTLESLVVAERVARAVRARAERGEINAEDFPLLLHVDDIITRGASVSIPWDKFRFEK